MALGMQIPNNLAPADPNLEALLTAGMPPAESRLEQVQEDAPVEVKPELQQVDLEPEEELDTLSAVAEIMNIPREELVKLKKHYGEIHVLPINENHTYLYRVLKRLEWTKLKNMFTEAGEALDEDGRKQKIVETCLIAPNINFSLAPAGLVDALYAAISTSSLFLSDQMVMGLILRL